MLALQLLTDGIVTGCALGMIAISFSLVYSTTRIFHVAHAGIFSLGGYVAWSGVSHGWPFPIAVLVALLACVGVGSLIQSQLYRRLDQSGASHLVVLIASIGALAIIQNLLSAVYSADVLSFPVSWAAATVKAGPVTMTYPQVAKLVTGVAVYGLVMLLTQRTLLGKRIRAVASNPFLAQITRLQPADAHVVVMALASAIVCLPGILVPLDTGLQPYGGITLLLTATIAMMAGGVGSITGAFLLAVGIAVLQNLALLVIPGEWSIGITFFIFVIFMLARPRGLFAAA